MADISSTNPTANIQLTGNDLNIGTQPNPPLQAGGEFETKVAQFFVHEGQVEHLNNKPFMTREEWTNRLEQRTSKRDVQVGLLDMSQLSMRVRGDVIYFAFSKDDQASLGFLLEVLKDKEILADNALIEIPKSSKVIGTRDVGGSPQDVIVDGGTTMRDGVLNYLVNLAKEYNVRFNLKTQILDHREWK